MLYAHLKYIFTVVICQNLQQVKQIYSLSLNPICNNTLLDHLDAFVIDSTISCNNTNVSVATFCSSRYGSSYQTCDASRTGALNSISSTKIIHNFDITAD